MTTGLRPDSRAPSAGALVWVDFRGSEGTEQVGVRPAIVVSMTQWNRFSARSIVCPITSNVEPFPTKVLLPAGLAIGGAVLCDQVRALDRAVRGFRPIDQAPAEVLTQVRLVILQLMTDLA